MIFKILKSLTIIFVMLGLSLSGAKAQSVQLLSDHKDWSAFTTSQGGNKICFTLSKPKTISPKPQGYKQAYLYISHRPGENIRNELNLIAGFEFAQNSNATIQVGSLTYDLFTKDDSAWLDDISKSAELLGQMRAGATLNVSGLTKTGVKVTQVYSLSGVTAASRAIDRACNK